MLYPETVGFGTSTIEITFGNSEAENTRIVRLWVGEASGNITDITANTDIRGSGPLLIAGGTAKKALT